MKGNNWVLGTIYCIPIEGYLWVEVVNDVIGMVEEKKGEVCSIGAEDAINLWGKEQKKNVAMMHIIQRAIEESAQLSSPSTLLEHL